MLTETMTHAEVYRDLDPLRVKRSLRAIEGQWANGRHVKGGPVPTHKIDIVHALEDALHGFDITEGRVES